MRKIILGILVFSATPAMAQEASESFMEKKIRKGDWTVGGEGALSYTTWGGTRVYANAEAQYFFADRLSAGMFMSLQGGKYQDASGVGVLGTYHFYEGKSTTMYGSLGLSHHQVNSEFFSSNTQYATMANATLGFNYFLNPHVAFGPRIEYKRLLNDNLPVLNNKDSQVNVMLGFSYFF